MPESPRVHDSNHLPKITVIMANAQPDSSHDFDGKISIWSTCVLKMAEQSSKSRDEGRRLRNTIDVDWHKTWYLDKLLPVVKLEVPWKRPKRVAVQQDGASPHRGTPPHPKFSTLQGWGGVGRQRL